MVEELAERGIIQPEESTNARNYYFNETLKIVGHKLTPEQINQLASGAESTKGFGLFLNIVIVLAGFILLFFRHRSHRLLFPGFSKVAAGAGL